jgi:predicted ATPase
MNTLQQLSIAGFKSIREMDDLELKPLNVLIGANGAGKSNLISFFRMLNFAMTGSLGTYLGDAGYANSLLHFGAQRTPQMSATLRFKTPAGVNSYIFRLAHAAGDKLLFTEESVEWHAEGYATPKKILLGMGHLESALNDKQWQDDTTVKIVRRLLGATRVYQFHNTSATAHLRNKSEVDNNRYLFDNGGNLAAMLFYLKNRHRDIYDTIEDTIRQVAPFFDEWVLEPDKLNPRFIGLSWREMGTPTELGAHQLSDGSLRFMALATLLSLPANDLPGIIIIDEPELGLHPTAIQVLAGLLRAASTRAQVIVSTQSVTLVNQISAEDVIVVEREDGQSVFRRLDSPSLQDWLSQYALGELWEKNVLGGRP